MYTRDVYICLQAKDVKISESEYNMEFVLKMIPKLDWKVLVNAAEQVRYGLSTHKRTILVDCFFLDWTW